MKAGIGVEQARIRVLLEQFLRPGRDRCQIVDGERAALGLDTDLVCQTVVKCEAHQHDARLHRKPDRCEGAFDTLCDDDPEVPLEAPHELIDRIVHATPCVQAGGPASGGHSSTVMAMNRADAAARASSSGSATPCGPQQWRRARALPALLRLSPAHRRPRRAVGRTRRLRRRTRRAPLPARSARRWTASTSRCPCGSPIRTCLRGRGRSERSGSRRTNRGCHADG